MDRRLTGLMLLLVAFPCVGQDYSGWGALGEMLGGRNTRSQAVYEDAYRERMETEAAYWNAVRARQEADQAEQQLEMIQLLEARWLTVGLPADEARAVAYAFEYTPDMEAVIAKARKGGSMDSYRAAGEAYRSYRFLLANQLLIAAAMAEKDEHARLSLTPRMFGRFACQNDCSGHEAGYEWAEENGITDPDDCGGNSQSFVEGCLAWAEEQ